MFLLGYILTLSKNKTIRAITKVSFGVFIIKLIYEIVLMFRTGYDYMQQIESSMWTGIFIMYLIISLFYVRINKT